MSASQATALTAIAFQFAAALEGYEVEIEQMIGQRRNPETYQKVSKRMDEMRLYAATLPRVSVAWVELLIRHFELTHGLWMEQKGSLDAEGVAALFEAQAQATRRLRQHCLQLVAHPPEPGEA